MKLPELQQGLQDIQQKEAEDSAQPWLNMDNLMQSYGSWFDNDNGLGEMLLNQLRAHGVDTQAATESMLRELLSGLVDDLNMLQMKLTGFTSAVAQQLQQTQAVADSVQAALDGSGATPMAQQIAPPESTMPLMNDLPPDMGQPMGGMPPEMPPENAAPPEVPPENATPPEMPPENAAPPEMPPENAAPPEMPPEGTPSDRRIKYVLSDSSMKHLKQRCGASRISTGILDACRGGF
jgi:hypothetical protein